MSSEGGRRELTATALVLGTLLAVVFGAANAYLGLRVGITVSASVPAAVVSMGVLRFLLRRDSALENNMVQTIGSAGESLAAGAIFTMPAIYLWEQEGAVVSPGFGPLTLIALAGGVLGVLFMVPLRRPLVEGDDALVYPEGCACAEVIRAGEKGAKGARRVFFGLFAAAGLKLATDALGWIPASATVRLDRCRTALGTEISAALAGVGFIVGLRVAALQFAGAALGWVALMPLLCAVHAPAEAAFARAGAPGVWRDCVRFVGAGAIAAGGFISLVRTLPLFARTVRGALRGAAEGARGGDLPLGRVAAGAVAVVVLLALAPGVPVGWGGAALVALFGFLFAAVSARMVGLVGSSNNPVSGMAIATLVVASLAMRACGTDGAAGMLAAISVGSVVCIVAAIAGDTAQDLKTGRLLGATPWRQQTGELVGVAASGLAITGVLLLLHRAWGFGGDEMPAPQAMLMKSIVEGVMGGGLPWGLLAAGAGIAVVLAAFRVPVMPVAIGLYLPFGMSAAIMFGGLLRAWADRRGGGLSDRGVLVSAGAIAGEGLCGIALAVVKLL